MSGSGGVVCSWFLLFTATIAVVRQKFHLSSCSDFRSRLFELQVGNHKSALDRQIETFKSDLKAKSDHQLEAFKNQLTERMAQKDRIRDEVARWSNPIPSSVTDLKNRLTNIVVDGYPALSPNVRQRVNLKWSIQYDYFFPSTIYLFSRYFCWTGLLEEKLSFELVDNQDDKEAFFARIRAVNRILSAFPL